ncbi:hypothetical protein CJD36_010515 [Flavipsychrobacter stenotrophus]|uniref:Uncharacterized protein n=1 Tax=Flavipsychrobacter stenotrophus TaxID=2077091 RepID=A0A2S7SU01_9BACT|nr:hypothetical protein [Flavipsychrobacter stenotrophus]PQJ10402.1 hypothetical protein CJD36_010515 [Flavipsychrobacter stenotrophus]
MKKPGIIVLKHLVLWLLFSAIYILISEQLTKRIFSGIDYDVEQWLLVAIVGLLLIFTITVFSLVVSLLKNRKRRKLKADRS